MDYGETKINEIQAATSIGAQPQLALQLDVQAKLISELQGAYEKLEGKLSAVCIPIEPRPEVADKAQERINSVVVSTLRNHNERLNSLIFSIRDLRERAEV